MCLVPDGDLFEAIAEGRAEVVTDRIETFTEDGLRLESGDELEADVIVTATGLNLLALGGIELEVDGEPVELPEKMAYKGMMLEGVPNLAISFGYTNASWTLKCDLTCEYVCRLLNHMDAHGYAYCTPRNHDPSVTEEPFDRLQLRLRPALDRQLPAAGLEDARGACTRTTPATSSCCAAARSRTAPWSSLCRGLSAPARDARRYRQRGVDAGDPDGGHGDRGRLRARCSQGAALDEQRRRRRARARRPPRPMCRRRRRPKRRPSPPRSPPEPANARRPSARSRRRRPPSRRSRSGSRSSTPPGAYPVVWVRSRSRGRDAHRAGRRRAGRAGRPADRVRLAERLRRGRAARRLGRGHDPAAAQRPARLDQARPRAARGPAGPGTRSSSTSPSAAPTLRRAATNAAQLRGHRRRARHRHADRALRGHRHVPRRPRLGRLRLLRAGAQRDPAEPALGLARRQPDRDPRHLRAARRRRLARLRPRRRRGRREARRHASRSATPVFIRA